MQPTKRPIIEFEVLAQYQIYVENIYYYYVTYSSIKPLAPLAIFGSQTPVPRGIFEGGGFMTFRAKFKGAILKMEAKMTLLQFFGHISLNFGPILKIKKQGYS